MALNHTIAWVWWLIHCTAAAGDKMDITYDVYPDYDPCFDGGNPNCYPEPFERRHLCGAICYALIFVFALPILIIYGLIALIYLLFGCCFEHCKNCMDNKVGPDTVVSPEPSVDIQPVDNIVHIQSGDNIGYILSGDNNGHM